MIRFNAFCANFQWDQQIESKTEEKEREEHTALTKQNKTKQPTILWWVYQRSHWLCNAIKYINLKMERFFHVSNESLHSMLNVRTEQRENEPTKKVDKIISRTK